MSSCEKTIIFISNESKLFGAPKVLLQIIKHFHSLKKYQIIVICPEPGLFTDELSAAQIPFIVPTSLNAYYRHIGQPRNFLRKALQRIYDNLRLFHYFLRLLNSYSNPIVYANTAVVRYIAFPALISRTKLLWHIHEYFDNPLLQRLHSILIGTCANHIIAHSPTLISYYHFSPRLIQNKAIYFRNSAAFDREILSIADSNAFEYDLLYAGRISRQKGALDLLNAMVEVTKRKPNLTAILLGSFDEEDRHVIMDFVAQNGLEQHVTFPGFVTDVYRYIVKSRAVVLPTYRENFPMILLEALLLERPVIATKVGNIPNLVIDYENGFLIEPGDIRQLADAIDRILDEREYDRLKAGTRVMKRAILSQSDDYQKLRQVIDQINT